MMKIEGVVAVCTRGALLTEVLDGIVTNIIPRILTGNLWTIKTTSRDKIPDAQNNVTDTALKMCPEYIWYVEEDTVPPLGILNEMLLLDRLVVVADYNLKDNQKSICWNKEEIAYSGMGCMLVKTLLTDIIRPPWFDNGTWVYVPKSGEFSSLGHKFPNTQDVSFFVKLQKAGIAAVATRARCKHLRWEQGKDGGLHKIWEL